jgi:hypothetical protein
MVRDKAKICLALMAMEIGLLVTSPAPYFFSLKLRAPWPVFWDLSINSAFAKALLQPLTMLPHCL